MESNKRKHEDDDLESTTTLKHIKIDSLNNNNNNNNNTNNINNIPPFILKIILEHVVAATWKTKKVNYIAVVNKVWKSVAYEVYNKFYEEMYVPSPLCFILYLLFFSPSLFHLIFD